MKAESALITAVSLALSLGVFYWELLCNRVLRRKVLISGRCYWPTVESVTGDPRLKPIHQWPQRHNAFTHSQKGKSCSWFLTLGRNIVRVLGNWAGASPPPPHLTHSRPPPWPPPLRVIIVKTHVICDLMWNLHFGAQSYNGVRGLGGGMGGGGRGRKKSPSIVAKKLSRV